MLQDVKLVLDIARQLHNRFQQSNENQALCRQLASHVIDCLQSLRDCLNECQEFADKLNASPKYKVVNRLFLMANTKAHKDQVFEFERRFDAELQLLQTTLLVDNKQEFLDWRDGEYRVREQDGEAQQQAREQGTQARAQQVFDKLNRKQAALEAPDKFTAYL